MARELQLKTNVDAPDVDFPYGRIRDNLGMGDGTPYNELLYGDFHQFMSKMFAESGLTYNGDPDNETQGFQFFEALRNNIHKYKDIIVTFGNTTLLLDAFGCLIITLGGGIQTLPAQDANNNGRKITILNPFNAYTLVVAPGGSVLYPSASVELNASETVEVVQWSVGTFSAITRKYNTGVKSLPIGAWDMTATTALAVPHGLTLQKIKGVRATIIIDGQTTTYPLTAMINLTPGGGVWADATNINLRRFTNAEAGNVYAGALLSAFDNGNFSTLQNRGWITIDYAD